MLYQSGKPYSQDLRERVFAASDDGDRVGEIAELLRVSVSYVSMVLTRRRTTGETTARAQRNRVTPKLAPLYDAIRARVAERPDGTIEELRAWLLAAHAMSASVGLIWKTLKQLGLTLKKRVLRCLEWVATISIWQHEIEFTGEQVDHGFEIADRSIAASLRLGGLDEAVDALNQAIGDPAVEPAQDAIPVAFDGTCGIDDRRQPTMGCPEVPLLEEDHCRVR